MKTNTFLKMTGASLMALGMSVAPVTYNAVQAQDSDPNQEMVDTEASESAGENFEEAEQSLERAGQEATQGVEAAGEAAEQQVNQTAQDAAQSAEQASQAAQEASRDAAQQAEQAAERAEVAAEDAVNSIQQRSNWGWLGLFGLIGLFGLAGGSKSRSDSRTDEAYYRERPTTTTTGEYRS